MMKILLATLLIYALSLVLTAVGSRLAGRCTTWCCALLGLPMWVVGGTVTPLCLALPQLVLAFLAAGMSVTALAVGTALAGAVTNLGLALAVCLLSRRRYAVADRDELCRKAVLLLAACGVLAVFVRDGELSYTGTGLLMGLFVLFVLTSIVFQHRFTYGETIEVLSTSEETPRRRLDAQKYGYTAHTMAFPVMSVWNALKNLAGVLGGLALLYVLAVLPLWFKRPNPVIFVPVDFAAIGVYLLYVDLATRGGWFFSFALPVTGAAMVLVTAVVTLLRYVPSGALYTLGGGLILAGGFNVLVEFLLNLNFHVHDEFIWSFYPFSVSFILGVMLIVIGICRPLRESLHKKFFL
mgnify:CR=1 FL=1